MPSSRMHPAQQPQQALSLPLIWPARCSSLRPTRALLWLPQRTELALKLVEAGRISGPRPTARRGRRRGRRARVIVVASAVIRRRRRHRRRRLHDGGVEGRRRRRRRVRPAKLPAPFA